MRAALKTLSTVFTRISAAVLINPKCGAYLSNYCNLQLKSLLHLGQNLITFRTLLHLGSFITFRPSTPCERSISLHLDLVPRKFLLQLKVFITILSIFQQNTLRTLLAAEHCIPSESDGVKSGSAAGRNNTRKNQPNRFNEKL